VGVRLANAGDIDFLFRRMLSELRQIAPWRQMPRSLYYPYMHRRLEHTLTRAVIRVAYPKAWEENGKVISGNLRHILGFIIADPSDIGLVVHYVYTRRDYTPKGGHIKACYRKQGIGKKLLESMVRDYKADHIVFTLWGQELLIDQEFFNKIMVENASLFTYNPELFTTLLPEKWERGIVATLNPEEAMAFNKAKAIGPVDF